MIAVIVVLALQLLVFAILIVSFSPCAYEHEGNVWENRCKRDDLELQLLRQQERDEGFIRQIRKGQERLQQARQETMRLRARMTVRASFPRRPREAHLALAWTRRRTVYRRILMWRRFRKIVQSLNVSPEYSLKETDT
jgi:hypothetical protein